LPVISLALPEILSDVEPTVVSPSFSFTSGADCV